MIANPSERLTEYFLLIYWVLSFVTTCKKSERIFIPEVHYRLNSILCQEQRFQLVAFLY